MDGTGPQPLNDSQLDRELEAALEIEPSSEFLARVRMRVAAEPETAMWRRVLSGRGLQPLVALGVSAVVLAVVIPQLMRDDAVRVERAAETPQVAGEVIAPQVPDVAPPPRTALRVAVKPTGQFENGIHTVPLQLSPVLFGEDDQRTFALYVAAVTAGRVPDEVRTRGGEEMTALSILPLVIDPLPVLARLDKQGEGQW